jgi:hypothetical protein
MTMHRPMCQAQVLLDAGAETVGHRIEMDHLGEPLRIMLGFVVRQCAVALGHAPSADELAEWANAQRDERGHYCIFGRAISADEARVILKHPSRLVTVRQGPRWQFPGLVAVR